MKVCVNKETKQVFCSRSCFNNFYEYPEDNEYSVLDLYLFNYGDNPANFIVNIYECPCCGFTLKGINEERMLHEKVI